MNARPATGRTAGATSADCSRGSSSQSVRRGPPPPSRATALAHSSAPHGPACARSSPQPQHSGFIQTPRNNKNAVYYAREKEREKERTAARESSSTQACARAHNPSHCDSREPRYIKGDVRSRKSTSSIKALVV
jgi:hypothetical protein